jgi:hypothetical protein
MATNQFFGRITAVQNAKEEFVKPDDILDALKTLSFETKISQYHPFPGKGPDFFLDWANSELTEAETSIDENSKFRKFYNTSVHSKAAVECLIDWYLSKFMLQVTIPRMAGAGQKLKALDSENLLGVSFSLFNHVVFEPRNRGIHKYELVKADEAKYAYELAYLTIKNCINTVDPTTAPVYYGNIAIHRDAEAIMKMGGTITDLNRSVKAFHFDGIGEVGSHGVLLDRFSKDGKITLLLAGPNYRYEARSCKIKGVFSSDQLREVFNQLNKNEPKEISGMSDEEREYVINSLFPHSNLD